jgi:hypothetical protein
VHGQGQINPTVAGLVAEFSDLRVVLLTDKFYTFAQVSQVDCLAGIRQFGHLFEGAAMGFEVFRKVPTALVVADRREFLR